MRKVFVCLLVILMLAVTVSAQTSFVADELNLLTKEQIADLNQRFSVYRESYDVSIAVVTTDDLKEMTIADYADDYYQQSGFTNDCVLLVICEAEGQWFIYTHGLAAEVITDADIATIGQVILNDLQDGDYYNVVETVVKMTAEPICRQVTDFQEEAEALQRSQQRAVVFGLIGGFVVGVAVAVLLGFVAKGRQIFYKGKHAGSQEPNNDLQA